LSSAFTGGFNERLLTLTFMKPFLKKPNVFRCTFCLTSSYEKEESLQISYSVTVLAELNTATCRSNRRGSRVTKVDTPANFCKIPSDIANYFIGINQLFQEPQHELQTNVSVLIT